MELSIIFPLITLILGALTTAIPIMTKWNKARKAKKNAVTEADKEKAKNDMYESAINMIVLAEKTFNGFDKVMKQQSSSAGSLKKQTVMSDLQSYALSKGYTFDKEYWSAKIDEIVAFTKEVNS